MISSELELVSQKWSHTQTKVDPDWKWFQIELRLLNKFYDTWVPIVDLKSKILSHLLSSYPSFSIDNQGTNSLSDVGDIFEIHVNW